MTFVQKNYYTSAKTTKGFHLRVNSDILFVYGKAMY